MSKNITIKKGPTLRQIAFDFVLKAGRASASEIAAAVPGIEAKNVYTMLKEYVAQQDLATEAGRSKKNRAETIYLPGAKRQALRDAGTVTTVLPIAQTSAMTSVLKTGTKLGINAHGGPIRDTGPARDKGTPVSFSSPVKPAVAVRSASPTKSRPADVPLAAPKSPATKPGAASRAPTESTAEVLQMQQDQRNELEQDLIADVRVGHLGAPPETDLMARVIARVHHPRLPKGQHCACCRHDPMHDPDSELMLAVSALQALEALLCTADFDFAGGIAELLEPITARINSARMSFQEMTHAR